MLVEAWVVLQNHRTASSVPLAQVQKVQCSVSVFVGLRMRLACIGSEASEKQKAEDANRSVVWQRDEEVGFVVIGTVGTQHPGNMRAGEGWFIRITCSAHVARSGGVHDQIIG